MQAALRRSLAAVRWTPDPAALLVALAVALFIAYPVLTGLTLLDGPALQRMISAENGAPLLNSLLVAILTVVPSVAIGVPLAWLCARTDLPGRDAIAVLVSASFVTPILLIAIAYVFLLGRNAGLINAWWNDLFDAPLYDIYSFSGVVFVSVLHGYPLVFFTTLSGLARLNPEFEEAARISGLGPVQVFLRVTLGATMPSILAGTAFCLAESLTMLAAPLVLGLPVGLRFMTTEIYGAIVMSPNLAAAVSLSIPLVAITVAALWVQSWLQGDAGSSRFAVVGGKGARAETVRLGALRWPLLLVALTPLLFSLVLPVLALLGAALMDKWWRGFEPDNLTLDNFIYLFRDSTTRAAILNSLVLSVGIAAAMALAGAVVAILLGGAQDRLKQGVRRLVELPLGLPHVVAGVLVILAWYGPPFGFGGTLWLLAAGYVFMMLPYAVKTCEAARAQIDGQLEEAARSVGCSRVLGWRYVLLPLMKPGIFTTFVIVFLFVIKEFSFTAMAYSAATQTLAVRVYTFLEGGSFEKTAAAAMLLLVLTFAGLVLASKVFRVSAVGLKV